MLSARRRIVRTILIAHLRLEGVALLHPTTAQVVIGGDMIRRQRQGLLEVFLRVRVAALLERQVAEMGERLDVLRVGRQLALEMAAGLLELPLGAVPVADQILDVRYFRIELRGSFKGSCGPRVVVAAK